MQYHDMVVEAANATLERTPDKRRIGHFTVRVLGSPAGEMRPEDAVAVSYDDRQLQLTLQQLESRALDRAGLIALGRTLALCCCRPGPTARRPACASCWPPAWPRSGRTPGCACGCGCRRSWPRCRGSTPTSTGRAAATGWTASWRSTR